MEIGNNLKKLRAEKGMTQKELADELCVSSQAVSRWENNEVEPDISTLSKLSSIFGVSVDELISGKEPKKETGNEEAIAAASLAGAVAAAVQNKSVDDSQHICPECSNKETGSSESSSPSIVERKVIGSCSACGKTLYNTDKHHEVNVPASTSHRRGHTHHHGAYTKYYCEGCNELRLRGKLNYDGSKPKYGKKRLIFGLIFGIAALVIAMIVLLSSSTMAPFGAIMLSILLGYGVFAEIYCLFTDCYIGDVFMEVAGWSIKFPGIIFSFDLDGLAFLIVMKILFAILGALIGIAVFLLAIGISMFLSLFTFPFVARRSGV